MAYSRQAFLNLFTDADPYEYIFDTWAPAIALIPPYLDYAFAEYWEWQTLGKGEWPVATCDALAHVLSSILTMISYLILENEDEGTGISLLDVTYYGALYNRVTAERIMEAWINATRQERLMTVLTLDELRRESWDQEFITYRIAEPQS